MMKPPGKAYLRSKGVTRSWLSESLISVDERERYKISKKTKQKNSSLYSGCAFKSFWNLLDKHIIGNRSVIVLRASIRVESFDDANDPINHWSGPIFLGTGFVRVFPIVMMTVPGNLISWEQLLHQSIHHLFSRQLVMTQNLWHWLDSG